MGSQSAWLPLVVMLASAGGEDVGLDGATPLSLDEVLESTELHYPPLLAAIQEIEAARGTVVGASGKFDTNIRFGAGMDRFGFYENERFDVGIEQAVQWWGAKLYAGWRIGQGGFAPYNGLAATRDGGEFRAGIALPLLRDRGTDEARAELERGQIGVAIDALSVDEQRLAIRQLATSAYWDWVAAGQVLGVARNVLDIALARDTFVRESVAAGALAAIEVTDNRRAILSRRSSVIAAEQKLRKAAIYLSLYYRSPDGVPVVPSDERVPERFPEPHPFELERVDEDVDVALGRRPELRLVRAEADRVQVDERLAFNAREPSLDLKLGATAEAGSSPTVKRGPTELKAGLVFELPIQQRGADGKFLEARAKLAQLRRKEQFLIDKIEVEVRSAALAMDASHQRAALLGEEVAVARELQSLELDRYDLGDSDLFTVNLREEAAAAVEIRWLDSLAEYQRACALYQLVTAEPLRTVP